MTARIVSTEVAERPSGKFLVRMLVADHEDAEQAKTHLTIQVETETADIPLLAELQVDALRKAKAAIDEQRKGLIPQINQRA